MAEEIIIKIDVSSGDAKREIGNVEKAVDGLSKAEKERIRLQKELNFQLSKEAKELASLKIAIKDQIQANNQYAQSQIGGSKASKQFRAQAGLNNAILLESGRLASDAAYGFTAIANNLSQLVSLFGSFTKTAGGLTESFRELGRSLMGTGGVLLAVQLLIGALQSKKVQEFIMSLFGATDAVRALRKALGEATDVYGAQIGKLTTLTRLLEDKRLNDAQRKDVLKELKKDNEDLNIQLDENNTLTEESNRQVEAKIALLKLQAKTQALVTAIEQETVEQLKLQNSTADENISYLGVLMGALTSFGNVNAAITEGVIQGEEDKRKGLEKSQKIIDKLYEELTKVVNFGDDKDSKKGQRRVRQFKQQLLDLSKTILNYNKQAEAILGRSAQEQLDVDEEFAKKEADRKLKSFRKRQEQRLEEYKEQVKGQKNANKLIENAETEFNESMEDAKLEHQELLLSIDDAYTTRRILLKDKEAKALAKIERQIEDTEMQRFIQAEGVSEVFYAKKEEQISSDLFIAQAAAADTTKTDQERAQARLEILNLEDEQRELAYQREIDRIETKKAINMEYVSFAQGLSGILAGIAGENEEVQKAALIIEKGAAIAGVVVNTQQANATAIANESKMPVLLPNLVPPFIPYPNPAKPASMAATGAQLTRNNVQAGISIASILATTLSSFSNPKGSSSGGPATAATVQAPAFNVVGPSTTDQLLGDVQQGLSDVKLSVNLNEINEGQETLNFIGTEANVFPD